MLFRRHRYQCVCLPPDSSRRPGRAREDPQQGLRSPHAARQRHGHRGNNINSNNSSNVITINSNNTSNRNTINSNTTINSTNTLDIDTSTSNDMGVEVYAAVYDMQDSGGTACLTLLV